MSKLSAVFFDVDDTLFSTAEFAEAARRNGIRAMVAAGLRLDPEDAYRELLEIVREFSANYDSHYDKLMLRLPPRCYAGVNPAIIVAAGVIAYHETKARELKPFPDVLPALARLARTELILGVISNGLAVKQAEKILRLGILRYLTPTAIFISDQIGIGKPNPKLYRRACLDLQLDPTKVMHVGDSPLLDIDPANEAGLITVRNLRTKKQHEPGRTPPHHEIREFSELLAILERQYGVKVPE